MAENKTLTVAHGIISQQEGVLKMRIMPKMTDKLCF